MPSRTSTWFPLGPVVLAAVPFYRPGRHTVTCGPALGARGGAQIIHRGTGIQVVGGPGGIHRIVALFLT